MPVFAGRHTARIEGDLVVFLIGMRINRPWKLQRWLPIFAAMRPMIGELEYDPEAGFSGATRGLLASGPALVRYWRSFDHLERYARRSDARHLPAWPRLDQRVRNSSDVGIWHETDRVRAGEYEAIYANVPRVGRGQPCADRQQQRHRRAARRCAPRGPAPRPRLLTFGDVSHLALDDGGDLTADLLAGGNPNR